MTSVGSKEDFSVQWGCPCIHQEVIKSECGQAYPEYIAPRERNNRVKPWGTDHRNERFFAPQNKIRISSLPQILEMMSPGLSTREWPLPVTCGHPAGESATYMVKSNKGKSEQDNVCKVISL